MKSKSSALNGIYFNFLIDQNLIKPTLYFKHNSEPESWTLEIEIL